MTEFCTVDCIALLHYRWDGTPYADRRMPSVVRAADRLRKAGLVDAGGSLTADGEAACRRMLDAVRSTSPVLVDSSGQVHRYRCSDCFDAELRRGTGGMNFLTNFCPNCGVRVDWGATPD